MNSIVKMTRTDKIICGLVTGGILKSCAPSAAILEMIAYAMLLESAEA